jgi:DNA-binding NarL/FixJ family response regulator
MDTYRIVLADNQTMVRRGIRRILELLGGIEVVGEAKDESELLDLVEAVKPHLVIVNILMPELRGVEAIRAIKMMSSHIMVLILTEHKGRLRLHQVTSLGVEGYLFKEDSDTELLLAVETIRKGKRYISARVCDGLKDEFSQLLTGDYEPPSDPLTSREREITKLIAEGKTSKDIARMLFISIRTVECHRWNIMRKLKLKNLPELVRYAVLSELG